MSNYIRYRVRVEIIYPFPNFNGGTVEVWEWISNSIPHFTGHVITYPCLDWRLCDDLSMPHIVKGSPGSISHDDVIKWKHFPRNWPFVRGIHRSRWIPHTKASDAELLFSLFSLTCSWINGWVNNCEAGDLRRHRGHYDVNVTKLMCRSPVLSNTCQLWLCHWWYLDISFHVGFNYSSMTNFQG